MIRLRSVASPWTVGSALIASIVAVAPLSVVVLALTPEGEAIWGHLASTVLPGYLINTALLLLGVGLGTLVIGTGCAWLVTLYRFPGQRLFEWALLLPLAVPAFILGFTYTELLDYAGPVQATLRALAGWSSPRDYWFPEVRSLGGAILLMSLVLYPYVYLLARAAFLEQSLCTLEVSRTLGCTPLAAFFRVALPLARPSLVVGVALALMEALNDYGTVKLFNVHTLTSGLYNVWLIMGNRQGAAQIACVLLTFVVALIIAERLARAKRAYHGAGGRSRPIEGRPLNALAGGAALIVCALPVVLGFGVPAAVLLRNTLVRLPEAIDGPLLGYARASLTLSTLAAAIALALGLFLAYAGRLDPSPLTRWLGRLSGLGYALPGTVLAIGLLVPFGAFDNALDGWMRAHFGLSTGLLLSGSLFALVFAYVVRFLALSFGTAESGLARVRPSLDSAARSLGCRPAQVLARVHLPLIKGSLLTAALLVFVDSMKELPASLLLRPFNVETLATHVFQFASSEQIERAAPGALAIVATGLIPVIVLSRAIAQARSWRGSPGETPSQ
ncbi:iron ABC transporter permease [Rhodospirillum rubrum]|uniref:ABC transporter permease n=1 Tax=Rhodospirillum rubrum TaxID=1085 RepID=UPI0019065C77|nr:iron ABC transporter permease [Rhodospirillum rubrum]MBK1663607.1 iron ABC transporter permease [Rhodospirillum rubrum]MBK1675946.1 iron ABC transporter permease [Rhodospirillum rubrum]